MAFLTLDALRTGYLNPELGITADTTDVTFGDPTARNFYLQNAIRKLWPVVARLTSETLTMLDSDQTYTLTEIEDVARLEVLDLSNNQLLASTIRSWQVLRDEATDPPTLRLLIPTMTAGVSVRVVGYVPYTVPTSSPPASSGTTDFPPRIAHVVSTGARAEAYRAKLNQFANYTQFANENRQNVLQPGELLELLRTAEREFERLKADHQRDFSAPKRARTQIG